MQTQVSLVKLIRNGLYQARLIESAGPAKQAVNHYESPWCNTWERAKGWAEKRAKKMDFLIAFSD